jgi:hypothetical protein
VSSEVQIEFKIFNHHSAPFHTQVVYEMTKIGFRGFKLILGVLMNCKELNPVVEKLVPP